MIEVKQAVQAARAYAENVLDRPSPTVDEIERESYCNRDAWKITLGFATFAGLGLKLKESKEYRSFFVDAETGEVLAVKIRELAA